MKNTLVKNILKVIGAFAIVLIMGAILTRNDDTSSSDSEYNDENRSKLGAAARLIWDEKECFNNNWGACTNAGVTYSDGDGVKQDYAKALDRFTKACDHDDDAGCYDLGIVYENGEGVKADYNQAVALYKKSCDLGSASGCGVYGKHLIKIATTSSEAIQGIQLIEQACEDKNGQSCAKLGFLYSEGDAFVTKDSIKAFAYFSKGCENGYSDGCFMQASAYEAGSGITQNIPKALTIYKNICETTADGAACYNAGLILSGIHDDLAANETEALKYFTIGCEKGNDEDSCKEMQELL
jgi:TPR repeat protein